MPGAIDGKVHMLKASSIGIGLSVGRELTCLAFEGCWWPCMSPRRIHESGTQISRIGSDNGIYGWELQAQE